MSLEYWIAAIGVTMLICGILALYFSRHEPLRNGYQARQRTRIKGGRVAIIEPKDDPRIVGDGAWQATKAKYPTSARVRDIEPRAL
jgi:hypothetical protein